LINYQTRKNTALAHIRKKGLKGEVSAKWKLRFIEYLASKKSFRDRALKKEFDVVVMADPDGKIIEHVSWWPNWMRGLAGVAGFVLDGGGFNKLTIPGSQGNIGNLSFVKYKPGKIDIECAPSFVPLALMGIELKEDSVVFTEKGIGGGPDMIRMWTSSAMRRVETPMKGGGAIFEAEYPIWRKVVIGLDDTDSSVKGATFNTALQIASIIDKGLTDVKFIRLTISLNWPKNPDKTTNNASTALVFAVKPGKEEALVREFQRLATKYTISKDTGMTIMTKIQAPESLKAYAMKVKTVRVGVSEAYKAAEEAGVRTIPITGERGLIGALSAIGLVDNLEKAITPIENTS
jgi:methanogenesis imperfect marker protein 11